MVINMPSPLHPFSFQTGDVVRNHIYQIIFPGDFAESLRLMCHSCTVNYPATAPLDLAWMTGYISLVGRQSTVVTFDAQFYVGVENSHDTLSELIKWRKVCWDHDSGKIGRPVDYKKPVEVAIYDPYAESIIYEWEAQGCWPENITGINLDAKANDYLGVSATFRCDKLVPQERR